MIYVYAVQQPEPDWYMQTDKDIVVSMTEPLGCCCNNFMKSQVLIGLVTSLMFQNGLCLNKHHQVLQVLI